MVDKTVLAGSHVIMFDSVLVALINDVGSVPS